MCSIGGWGLGICAAIGIEAATGCGFPGPLFLLALAAGFALPSLAGMLIGTGIGFTIGVLNGSHLLLYTLVGMAASIGAGFITRYVSRRNIFVVTFTCLLLSFLLSFAGALLIHQPIAAAMKLAMMRGASNILWAIMIYGIVLVASTRQSPAKIWEY